MYALYYHHTATDTNEQGPCEVKTTCLKVCSPDEKPPTAVFCATILSTSNAYRRGTRKSACTKTEARLKIFQMLIVRSGHLLVGRHKYPTLAI